MNRAYLEMEWTVRELAPDGFKYLIYTEIAYYEIPEHGFHYSEVMNWFRKSIGHEVKIFIKDGLIESFVDCDESRRRGYDCGVDFL